MEHEEHAHLVELTPDDIHGKGLKKNVIGLPGSITIALASVAPAFSLAATIGFLALEVGNQAPAVMIVAFIPILLVAFAYRELNRVMPDSGTSFTWGTKAFGPWVGWMAGWGLAASGIIFVANAADVVSNYTLQLFGADNLADNKLVVIAIGVTFIVLMTWVTYRGLEGSTKMQYGLVAIQYIVLIVLAIVAIISAGNGSGVDGGQAFSWSWLNPLELSDWGSFTAAFLLALFIYWGWDTALAVNEETSNSTKTPGRAGVISTVLLLSLYLLVTVAVLMYAGLGDTNGLGNVDNAGDVFNLIAEPLLGSWGAPLLVLTVLLSTAAALQTTIMPTARGALAMGVYKAAPASFARISPKFLTPSYATVLMGLVGTIFYVGLKLISANILEDTIASIGLAIAFYYGITAYACVWWFRKEIFLSVRNFFVLGLFPLLGGIILTAAFIRSAMDMVSPDYGNTSLFGVGGVFILGVGSLLFGVVLMVIYSRIAPPFFKGNTLHKDTPILVREEVGLDEIPGVS